MIFRRSIKLRDDLLEKLQSNKEDHNHFLDLYFVLLYKFEKKTFLEEVSTSKVFRIRPHYDNLCHLATEFCAWEDF